MTGWEGGETAGEDLRVAQASQPVQRKPRAPSLAARTTRSGTASATTRTRMSLSVIIPSSLPVSSTTRRHPILSSNIFLAASFMVSVLFIVIGGELMISDTLRGIFFLGLLKRGIKAHPCQ